MNVWIFSGEMSISCTPIGHIYRTARGVHWRGQVVHAKITVCTPITRVIFGVHAEDLPQNCHTLQTGPTASDGEVLANRVCIVVRKLCSRSYFPSILWICQSMNVPINAFKLSTTLIKQWKCKPLLAFFIKTRSWAIMSGAFVANSPPMTRFLIMLFTEKLKRQLYMGAW